MWTRFKRWVFLLWRTPPYLPDIGQVRARARNVAIGSVEVSNTDSAGQGIPITYGQIQANTIIASRINVRDDIAPAQILPSSRATDISDPPENRRLSTSVDGATHPKVHIMAIKRKAWIDEDRPSIIAKREAEETARRLKEAKEAAYQEQLRQRARQQERERQAELKATMRQRARIAEQNLEGYERMCLLLDGEMRMDIRELDQTGYSHGLHTPPVLGDYQTMGTSDAVVHEAFEKLSPICGYLPGHYNMRPEMYKDVVTNQYIFGMRPSLDPIEGYAYYFAGNISLSHNSNGEQRVSIALLPATINRSRTDEYMMATQTRLLAPSQIRLLPSIYTAAARRRLPSFMGRNLQSIIALPRNRTEDIKSYRICPQTLTQALQCKNLDEWKGSDGGSVTTIGLRAEFGAHEYIMRGAR